MTRLPPIAACAACVAGLAAVLFGCELVAGIKDKVEGDLTPPCSDQTGDDLLYCADFDSVSDAGVGWGFVTLTEGGAVDLDPAVFTSRPNSARITIPGPPAGAQLGKDVGTLQTQYDLEFDLYIDLPDLTPFPQLGLGQVYRAIQDPGFSVAYVIGPGKQCMVQLYYDSAEQDVPIALPPTRKWTRIGLHYDSTNGVSVTEDGVTLADSLSGTAHGPPEETQFIVGAVYSDPPGSTPVEVHIDTVVMRGK